MDIVNSYDTRFSLHSVNKKTRTTTVAFFQTLQRFRSVTGLRSPWEASQSCRRMQREGFHISRILHARLMDDKPTLLQMAIQPVTRKREIPLRTEKSSF